jgi:hypothetical protein
MEEHIKKYSNIGKVNNSAFVDEARVGLMDGYGNPNQVDQNSGYYQSQGYQPYYNQNNYTQNESQSCDSFGKKMNIWAITCVTIAIYGILAYIILVYK